MQIRPIILTGGSGTRLWPLSRKNFPKPYTNIFGDKTLLEITLKRIMVVRYFSNPIIIGNEIHKFIIKETLEKLNIKAKTILEPEGRGLLPLFT